MNPEGTVHLLDTPMAIPHFAERVMGPFGKIWLGIGLLFAGAATINTLMAGLPRILYGDGDGWRSASCLRLPSSAAEDAAGGNRFSQR